MHRLAWLDRPTGELFRRCERAHPGELVHVDVKNLAVIRPGGGWRVHGKGLAQHNHTRTEQLAGRQVGYNYVHSCRRDGCRPPNSSAGWLHTYNHHRSHTALGGQPPSAVSPSTTLLGNTPIGRRGGGTWPWMSPVMAIEVWPRITSSFSEHRG
ncbi:hypothetical protein [Blastococcus sp. CT_GayMR16]|uniref:hypothetical protein n=1 Tax=Blastococcus sp. CT_GayMR16 TaxID=2559607 RepID=UPI00107489E2|nr:hypothetical protein [Blastococcus sp. CT_GayMR16]TFV91176.1 hypothetical protein E4P38_00775 [Blastococcus sp. CT_GayMR16]